MQVSYQLELDCYDFCSVDLKKELDGPRAAYKEHLDRLIEAKKKAKNKALAADGKAAATVVQAVTAASGDAEMPDAVTGGASTSEGSTGSPYLGAATGEWFACASVVGLHGLTWRNGARTMHAFFHAMHGVAC